MEPSEAGRDPQHHTEGGGFLMKCWCMQEQGTLNPHDNQVTLFPFLEKHHRLAADDRRTQGWGGGCCSLRDDFYNAWDPSAAWATRKGPRSCHCFWKSLGTQQEITHALAEVDFKTKQAIWTAWLTMGNQASGKGVHVLLTGWSSPRGCRPGYIYGGKA